MVSRLLLLFISDLQIRLTSEYVQDLQQKLVISADETCDNELIQCRKQVKLH